MRGFIKYLPVDYYVLLQENFQTKTKFVESNYIMFRNLPVVTHLTQKSLNLKRYASRQVTYEDISRCIEYKEIDKILSEELAVEELKFQLSKFGPVDSVELLNFSKEDITDIVSRATTKPTKDEMNTFEKMMQNAINNVDIKEEVDDFENVLRTHRHDLLKIMNYRATKSNAEIAKGYLDLTPKEQEEIAASILRKGKQLKNLNKGIFINGLLKFSDYESKLKFLLSPAYQFGMKFYDQQKNLYFYDADFGNTLSIQSKEFENKSLNHTWSIINSVLLNSGFTGDDLWMIGNLKSISDFKLENVLVRPNASVSVRFHNFYEAKEAFYYLAQSRMAGIKRFKIRYSNPTTNYISNLI